MNLLKQLPRLVLTLALLLGFVGAEATTCPNATVISGPLPIINQALVCGNTNDINVVNNNCGYFGSLAGNEALYTYTPVSTQTVSISYSAAAVPTGVSNEASILVFNGCPTTTGSSCVGAAGFSSYGSGLSLTVTLTAGITYYILFDSYSAGTSPCQRTFSLTPCLRPTAVSVSNAGTTNAQLNFTGTAPNYQIEWGSGNLGSSTNTRATTTGSPYIMTGLAPGTSYRAWVRSICAAGDTSLWDTGGYFSTAVACPAPVAVVFNNSSPNSATLSWSAGSSTPPSSGYSYEVRTSGTAGSGSAGLSASGTTASGVTTATVSGLAAATSYTFYVRANCGGNGYSTWTGGTAFNTSCGPVTVFPHTDAFAAVGLPLCWVASSAGSSAVQWTGKTTDGTHGIVGPKVGNAFAALDVYNASTNNNPYLLTTRPYALSAPAKQLQYYYYLGDGGYKGTTGVGGTDPYPLMVLGTTNGGTTWDTLYRHAVGNSSFASSNTLNSWSLNTLILPLNYAGQTVQFRFVSRSNYGYNSCNQALDEVTVNDAPACQVPLALTLSAITNSGLTASWTAPVAVPAGGYQYEVRTSGTAGSGTVGLAVSGNTAAGVTTANISGLTASGIYTIYVRSNCSNNVYSAWSIGKLFNTACAAPGAPASAGASRCGPGAVNVSATGAGSNFLWYDSSNSAFPFSAGSPVPTYKYNSGNVYVSSINTTNYGALGNTTIPITTGDTATRGIVIRATQDFRINSAQMYGSSNTGPGYISRAMFLIDSATGNSVYIQSSSNWNIGSNPQWITNTLDNCYLSAGRTYYLVARFTNGNVRRHTTGVNYNSPVYNNLGSVGTITGGYENGAATPSSYNYFHNLNISAICASPRVAVPITINPVPAVTVTATPNPVCAGNPVTLTATSANAGYNYKWFYSNSGSPKTGSTITDTPLYSTGYFLEAIDSSTGGINAGCAIFDSVFVVVNPLPASLVVTPAVPTGLCLGSAVQLKAVGVLPNSYIATPLFSENFNGLTNSMTNVALVGTANAAKGAWRVKGVGYTYKGVSFSSPTNTPFAMSNSDSAGNGQLNVALVSPALNVANAAGLALTFNHYFRPNNPAYDSALVQVTTNGGASWTGVKKYNYGYHGAANNFWADTISLDAYAGQSNIAFRFLHTTDSGLYWAIDDVKLLAKNQVPVSWIATPVATGGLPAGAGTPSVANAAIGATPTTVGTYTYTATVTGTGGCTRTATTAPVIVGLPPTAGTITVAGQSPTYTFTISGNANASVRGWWFADGTYDTTGNPLSTTHTFTANGNYLVKFYAASACGVDSAGAWVIVSNAAGVQNIAGEGNLKLFPNPAATFFTVQNSGPHKMKSVTVLNIVGAVVQELTAMDPQVQRIDMTTLPAGSYLVRVTLDNNLTVVRRLQITH